MPCWHLRPSYHWFVRYLCWKSGDFHGQAAAMHRLRSWVEASIPKNCATSFQEHWPTLDFSWDLDSKMVGQRRHFQIPLTSWAYCIILYGMNMDKFDKGAEWIFWSQLVLLPATCLPLQEGSIFLQIDAFVQRCCDLLEVCQGLQQFACRFLAPTS